MNKEIKFSGKISKIDNGMIYDAVSYMIIGSKKVIFGIGRSKSEWGKIIGNFDNDYKGKTAEVFARKNGNEYTLEGSKEYYIKLLVS
jgi:hypothetical protein